MGSSTSKSKSKLNKHTSYIAGKPCAPGKPILIYDPDNSDTDTVTIKWAPPLFDGGTKITGYLVEHRRTGSPYWVKASPIKVRQTQLTICGLEPGWKYQFRVTAENEIGLSEPSALSEPLIIFAHHSAAIVPYFINELNDISVLENEKVEFNVCFEGVPIPKISWYKRGLEIFSNRCQKIVTEGNTSKFIIYEASLSDESEIKCCATNRVGIAVTKAYIIVKAPPNIRLPRQYEESVVFEQNATIRLKVSVVGQPQPLIYWYFNGEHITPTDNKYEIDYFDNSALLKVNDAQKCDQGEYQIQAINEIGEDVASILVTIANKPQPPQNISINNIGDRSVTLSWTDPNNNNEYKINSYVIEYYKKDWNIWLKAGSSKQQSITLQELTGGTEYKFRVKAENSYGISNSSPETETIFIPGSNESVKTAATNIIDLGRRDAKTLPVQIKIEQNTFKSNTISKSMFDFQDHPHYENWKPQIPVKPARKRKKRISESETKLLNQNSSHLTNTKFSNLSLPEYNRDSNSPSPQPSSIMDDTSRASSESMSIPVTNKIHESNYKGSLTNLLVESSKRNFSEIHAASAPMSLSVPELVNEMSTFRPLQRKCVSSLEILNDSAASQLNVDKLTEDYFSNQISNINTANQKSFKSYYNYTSHEPVKISNRLLSEEILNDLSKIHELDDIRSDMIFKTPLSDTDSEPEIPNREFPTNYSFSKPYDDTSKPYDETKLHQLSSVSETSSEEKLSAISNESMTHTESKSANISRPKLSRNLKDLKCFCSADISPYSSFEQYSQGRYSPESGTFHYPDLFMESLTKSPKFQPVINSYTEIAAELVSKTRHSIDCSSNTTQESVNDSRLQRAKSLPVSATTFQRDGCNKNNHLGRVNIQQQKKKDIFNSTITKDIDSDKSDSDDDDDMDESDEEDDELYNYMLENENDTYHPGLRAPLSFEEALAISNPKRNASPTDHMFLETDNSYRSRDLHFMNRNYCDNDDEMEKTYSFANRKIKSCSPSLNQEKVTPRSILKPSLSIEQDTAILKTQKKINPVEYTKTFPLRKQVRIEEPFRIEDRISRVVDEYDTSVVVNHYSDIVKQFGNVQKPPVKRYLTYEELKAAAQIYENEENVLYDFSTDNLRVRDGTDNCSITTECKPAVNNFRSHLNLERVRHNVQFFFSIFFNVVMIILACWLYCFKDKRLAIPVIILTVYRQLYDKIKTKLLTFQIWNRKKTKNGNEVNLSQ